MSKPIIATTDNVAGERQAELKVFSANGYRATDIAKHLKVSRQLVSALAKRYAWPVMDMVGHENIYEPQAVDRYLLARRRTPLLRKLGQIFRGLAWDSDYDGECPECGTFAVFLALDKWQCEQEEHGSFLALTPDQQKAIERILDSKKPLSHLDPDAGKSKDTTEKVTGDTWSQQESL